MLPDTVTVHQGLGRGPGPATVHGTAGRNGGVEARITVFAGRRGEANEGRGGGHPRTLSPTCERHWDAKWITRIFSDLPPRDDTERRARTTSRQRQLAAQARRECSATGVVIRG